MTLVERRVSDRRVLKMVRQWLEVGVMEEGQDRETILGVPGRRDLALALEHHLHVFDVAWERQGVQLGTWFAMPMTRAGVRHAVSVRSGQATSA